MKFSMYFRRIAICNGSLSEELPRQHTKPFIFHMLPTVLWLRLSTRVLVSFSWLLNHMIYFKLRREWLLCKAEQIHKWQLCSSRTILCVILWICSSLLNSHSILRLRNITWSNSQLIQTRTHVEHLSNCSGEKRYTYIFQNLCKNFV